MTRVLYADVEKKAGGSVNIHACVLSLSNQTSDHTPAERKTRVRGVRGAGNTIINSRSLQPNTFNSKIDFQARERHIDLCVSYVSCTEYSINFMSILIFFIHDVYIYTAFVNIVPMILQSQI